MDKAEKKQVVSTINADVAEAASLIVVHYKGLTVEEITNLRKKIGKLGGEFKVAKNSLTKLALKGTKYEIVQELLAGPVAIAYSKDPVSAAKGIVEFANDNEKLVILGGAIGEEPIDVEGIKKLAKLPSIDQLRAGIIGMLNTPATRIARLLKEPGSQIARVISAHATN